jgi:PAS domain S-box-containing protein
MYLSRRGFFLPKSFKDILKIQKKLTVTPVVNPEFDLSVTGPVTFSVYQETDTHLILPRSFGINQFDKNEYENQIKIENNRNFNFKGSLRDYQQIIVDTVIPKIKDQFGGLISIPTGRGKTIIAVKLACQLQLKTLFIVHKTFFLEQTKEKFELFSNAKIGILQQKTIDVDNKDVVLSVNKAFCNMSGYDSNELIGKKAKDVLLKKEGIEIMNAKNTIRKNGIDDVYEIELFTKNRETKYWLISGAPNYNINGEVIGSLGIHLDITEIKTLIIKNENLISDLTESNIELSNYAHIVSHDLKTPLHSIASCVGWLKEENEGKLSKDSLEYISIINESIIDMDNLISSSLQFSELRSSKKENNKSETQLIVESVIMNIDINKIKTLSINILKPLPVIKLNNTKTKQVFQNLIENAYKYRDANKKSFVNINWEDKNEHIMFSIEDNGIGIAEEHFNFIFESFKKLNNRTDSSGIGLSIVKKIIETAGGKIWVDSKLNEGTTFYFTIPR